ncbi:MAG: hypothetical protein AB8B50_03730 [Pirellulaceae bacterium]
MHVPPPQPPAQSLSQCLDRLCFATVAMGMNIGQEVPDSSCKIAAQNSQRTIQMQLPGFVTRWGPEELGDAWPEFCELVKQFGLALATDVESLADLPPAAVPLRMGGRVNLRPVVPEELSTADLFVLTLQDESGVWGWPPEIGELSRIESFIASLRQAAGDNTPIGIGLAANARSSDLQLAIRAGADFLHLVSRGAGVDVCVGVAKARAMAVAQKKADLPILLEAPVTGEENLVKLLALGASAVSLDAFLESAVVHLTQRADDDNSGNQVGGMLSSLVAQPPGETSARPKLQPLNERLKAFEFELRDKLNLVGVIDMAGFNSNCLRALDASAAELFCLSKMDRD